MNTNARPDELIAEADRLCDLGLYLQVQPLLPSLASHPALRARVIGLCAQSHLGAHRQAEAQLLRLWRANRSDPWVAIAHLRALAYRRGPYQAWRRLSQYP